MPVSSADRNPVELLAEEFAERLRDGKTPSLDEYIDRYPQYAEQIRKLFPALVMMEQLKPAAGDLTGDFGGATPEESHPLERLGDYRIVREVGRGGMGVVYEAEQMSLGRHVALKVLPSSALLPTMHLERFQREAKAAARLHHTNIVPVFGVGECNGVRFYAMQFIRGEGLDKVLADVRRLRQHSVNAIPAEASIAHSLLNGRFESATTAAPDEPVEHPNRSASLVDPVSSSALSASGPEAEYCRGVARIGAQVADALAYAHRQGILHRDIKPSNLLLDLQGTAWVADFGLVKMEGTDDLTQQGDIVGTLRYMAPERFEGRSLPQSDVYALGVTLYEMLTLRPAFDDANKAKLIEKVLHEAPTGLRKIDPRIPRDLETIVLKCLAKDPGGRYASAEALAEDLHRFLADRPVKARRAGTGERLWRWARRNPAVASLLAIVGVLVLAVAVISTASTFWLKSSLSRAEEAERDQKLQTYEGFVTEAKYRRFSRREGQRFASLDAIRKALRLLPELDMSADKREEQRGLLRDLAIACLTLPDVHVAKEWEGWPEGSVSMAVDDRMELYARCDKQGNVTVRRIADDSEVMAIAGDGKPGWVYLAPEDQYLLLVRSDYRIEVRRMGEAKPFFTIPSVGSLFQGLRVTRDGRRLGLAWPNGRVDLYSLPDGTRTHRFQVESSDEINDGYTSIEFSPDGERLAIVGAWYNQPARQTLLVYDLRTAQPPLRLQHSDSICNVAWYPDSITIAAAGWNLNNEIHVWDVVSGKKLTEFTAQKGGAPLIRVNRTGDLLTSTSVWAGGFRMWQARTGQELLTIPGSTRGYSQLAPDGRLFTIGSEGTKLRLLECVPGQVRRTLVRDPRAVKGKRYHTPALHPRGQLLAVGMENGVGLWDLSSGREIGFLPIGLAYSTEFDDTGTLWTYGHAGMVRWPVREASDKFIVGPPQTYYHGPTFGVNMAITRDGRLAAAATAGDPAAIVYRTDRPHQPIRIGPHRDVRHLALSPDGRYLATASNGPHGVKVWETATGKHLADITSDTNTSSFTPDGKWLTTGGRWFEVGTWREGPGLPHWGLRSPDGRLLSSGETEIMLSDWQSGKRLAALSSPDQGRVLSIFNHDGTQMIGTDFDNLVIHVWDLRKLRAELSAIDLDWDQPPYPPAKAVRDTEPLEVRVDLGELKDDQFLGEDVAPERLRLIVAANSVALAFNPYNFHAYRLRGRAYGRLKESASALADYSMALAFLPADDPNRIDLLSRRIGNHLELQHLDEALADLRAIEKLDPARAALVRDTHARVLIRRASDLRRDPAAELRALRQASVIDPANVLAHNNLAWLLLTGPKESRDAKEALPHAQKAVDLSKTQLYLNTLGVALYRNEKAREAIGVLEQSLAAGKGDYDGFDLFFLAMCHSRLGDGPKAGERFRQGVKWMEAKSLPATHAEELKAFRAEAKEVLRLP